MLSQAAKNAIGSFNIWTEILLSWIIELNRCMLWTELGPPDLFVKSPHVTVFGDGAFH